MWPSSQRALLLLMLAARVLNNYNDKLTTAKLGPNSIAPLRKGGTTAGSERGTARNKTGMKTQSVQPQVFNTPPIGCPETRAQRSQLTTDHY
jgi:hypothetical protein